MEYSYFDRFSSKIKRINIPVPSYNEGVNTDSRSFLRGLKDICNYFLSPFLFKPKEYLIGRDIIVERLKAWLLKDRDRGASYLVTGYRGMGKTSYVNRVLEQLVGVVDSIQNYFAYFLYFIISFWPLLVFCYLNWSNSKLVGFKECSIIFLFLPFFLALLWWILARWPLLKEKLKRILFFAHTFFVAVFKEFKLINLKKITPTEWNRINNLIYGGNKKETNYSRICVKVNLGQEILQEKDILSVLTYQLYDKWRRYCQCSVVTIFETKALTAVLSFIAQVFFLQFFYDLPFLSKLFLIIGMYKDNYLKILNLSLDHKCSLLLLTLLCSLIYYIINLLFSWNRRSIRRKLNNLKKSVDASRIHKRGFAFSVKPNNQYAEGNLSGEDINSYKYDVADTRVIESQLIEILDYISSLSFAPTVYFVFDELDKIEDTDYVIDNEMPEYSNERNFPGGGASRRRKHTVMKLLANMKYFTTTAKAKFIFIAGREMYDGYLADFTDREAAASSLFDGVIYVESFCKNEKSDRNVTYNAETYIARQLIPHSFIKERIIKELIECKLKGSIYNNVDIDLKMYYEFLIMQYAQCASKVDIEEQKLFFDDARKCIDRVIILLYHFTVYLFQISNGSPKKMRINFTNYVQLIREPKVFMTTNKGMRKSPLDGDHLNITISQSSKFLLMLNEKDQRVIGFIHYISFPVNQIMSNADRFSDKLLVSASFLINHIYKFHKGGFSWRNLEQIPELLEVYKIPEFRSFINSILNYLLQTHMIMIHGGLYDYKFRKQISEEISIASKTSEEVSAIYNFTLDDSQSVKRHYLSLLEHIDHYHKKEGAQGNSSLAAFHHILGDLYLSDEEYNNALSHYKLALNLMYGDDFFSKVNERNPILQDPKLKNPKLILSIIRNHLKIGLAYEKRRSNLSAYSAYEEVIALLFHYRHFDERKFGLKFEVIQKSDWPERETELYPVDSDIKENDIIIVNPNKKDGCDEGQIDILEIEPIISKNNRYINNKNNSYKTRGSRMISDFSNLVTPEKHEVQQRLSLIGDTKYVFQAMLAKLFVLEKIELGGITRENLDVIEGEFNFLHLATNVHEKFIIASDFYRRLGDIMYYKNGLIGFNFKHKSDKKDNKKSDVLSESFVESLYYYGFNLRSELHDYCRKNNNFHFYSAVYKYCRLLDKNEIDLIYSSNNCFSDIKKALQKSAEFDSGSVLDLIVGQIIAFWQDDIIKNKYSKLPVNEIVKCNDDRLKYWKKNYTLPCYACRFYHQSLEILMKNWIGVEFQKGEHYALGVLRQIVLRGSARSSRQNFNLQFAEVLDTLGNTMFSCSSSEDEIRVDFFTRFLHDAQLLLYILDNDDALDAYSGDILSEYLLLKTDGSGSPKSHLETAMLYYLEASFLFRVSSERKKAVGSLHKILKIILNYLRVLRLYLDNQGKKSKYFTQSRALIGETIYEIKTIIVKQCLELLYNHYNFINVMEIQHLKWIFYTQMYEGITLTQLSLFPDIEEIMLNYYEIIKLCIVLEHDVCYGINSGSPLMHDINYDIVLVRKKLDDNKTKRYTIKKPKWHSIEERNKVFNSKLTIMYNNMSMGALRNESTVYGRMLSLKFKSEMNEYILKLALPDFDFKIQEQDDGPNYPFLTYFGLFDPSKDNKVNLQWKDYFNNIEIIDFDEYPKIDYCRLFLLEYLIKDSLFCLTEILETVTPYTTTTLFTDAFMAGIYFNLYKWSNLFEELFIFYKAIDSLSFKVRETAQMEKMSINDFFENYDLLLNKETVVRKLSIFQEKILSKMNIDQIHNLAEIYYKIWNCNYISARFYHSVVNTIKKPNMHYTLKNYAGEMSLFFYRKTKEINREGKAYKDMINGMFFLDDDLKNDTIQFDLAVERFRINSNDIDKRLNIIKNAITSSIYDLDRFGKNTETELSLNNRFDDQQININK